MEIRPSMGMATASMGMMRPPEMVQDSVAEPQESFASSGSPVRVIVQHQDKAKLEELRKAILANNPDNAIASELPLINGFVAELSPGSDGSVMPSLFKSKDEGLAITLDQEMGISDVDVENLQTQFEPLTTAPNVKLGVDELHQQGITGKGTTICVIDTGIAPHPDIKDRIIGFKDFVNGKTEPYDDVGHGTHCAGIAAGDGRSSDGKFVGVAPEANIVGVKVLGCGGQGNTSDIVKGIQWAVRHRKEYGIDVINLSIGGPVQITRWLDPVAMAVQVANRAGIVTVVAAGNSGDHAGTIESPGNARSAITIGALQDNGTETHSDDGVAFFSSRGPTKYDKLEKPDLVAPGVDITSLSNEGNSYKQMSGTSMATPFVAGVAAMMRQVQPKIKPGQVKSLLMNTAAQFDYMVDRHAQGAGIIDPLKSLQGASELKKH